jgi:hypothetical protein
MVGDILEGLSAQNFLHNRARTNEGNQRRSTATTVIQHPLGIKALPSNQLQLGLI